MNVTTKTAAVKLLDEYAGHLPRDFNDALRSLLSAQGESEPSTEHGWIPMTTRPKDGQRIVYWFEPFNTAAIGTYHSGLPSDPESFDTVSGRNGFTTVDPECPWWMPTPTDEQRARELARQGVGNG